MIVVLIALIGVMALTLDFGFVLLTRRQMQTGVNSAAKEGLRGSGLNDFDQNEQQQRRQNARDMIRLTFDDDFDPDGGNGTTIGAGVDSSLIQGNGFRATTIGPADTDLAQDLANRANYIFRPDRFQLNQPNLPHGDVVVGHYVSTDQEHREFADYQRTDFDLSDQDSVLIRMRRTHDPAGLDAVDGISSRGGGLPLMLARLGWMRAESAAADYSIRRDGVIVRATAIAQGNRAMSVGVGDQSLSPPLIGVAPLAVAFSDWQSLVTGQSNPLDSQLGQLEISGTFVTVPRLSPARAVFVSLPLSTLTTTWSGADAIEPGEYYAPIFEEVANGSGNVTEGLIVGFGRIGIEGAGSSFQLTKLSQIVAAENASTLPGMGWREQITSELIVHNAEFAALDPDQQTLAAGELIAGSLDWLRQISDPLLAPALVRTMR
ncbi:MAG: hypothetical protein MI861_16790 [Pirellulales bacterium]|nr:hypothetical protein [Pirellulales bacterium]